MNFIYEEIVDELGNKIIKKTNPDDSVSWIPAVLGNSDYQAYLESLNDNTVEAE